MQAALEKKLKGKLRQDKGGVVEVAEGQYVQLELEGEDPVWTLLGEFTDFQHNSIAEPDRAVDNTTIWMQDFSRDYFNKLLYDDSPGVNSMGNFYIEQSSGRYSVDGDATDWVTVPWRPPLRRQPGQAPRRTSGSSSRTWPTAGTTTDRGRQDARPDRRVPGAVRPLRPLRLRRRRQLRRARRLHRHLPVGARGRGRGGRRRRARRRRIWSHSWYANYPTSTRPARAVQQARRHPDRGQRLLGRQVHYPARERRRGRLHPRVRPRPGPARTCTTPRARTAPGSGRSCPPAPGWATATRHRHQAGAHGRLGEVPARLAQLRGGPCRPKSRVPSSARWSSTPSRRRACSSSCRRSR